MSDKCLNEDQKDSPASRRPKGLLPPAGRSAAPAYRRCPRGPAGGCKAHRRPVSPPRRAPEHTVASQVKSCSVTTGQEH